MTKDILLAAVFLLNIGLMALIAFDVMRRKKDSNEEKPTEAPSTPEQTQSSASPSPGRKASIG